MNNFNFIEMEYNSSQNQEIYDSLRHLLYETIYFYGHNFKYSREAYLFNSKKDFIFKPIIQNALMALNFKRNLRKIEKSKYGIISNAYFTWNEEFKRDNYNIFRPPWSIPALKNLALDSPIFLPDYHLYSISNEINQILLKGSYNEIVNPELFNKIEIFKNNFRKKIENYDIRALFVPYDTPFFENLSIKIFKELKKPSFIFLHGLPGRYNSIDDNRADYLVVWGEKIKENYIKAGVSKEKIIVSGHPYYKEFSNCLFRYSLENILIISKSIPWNQYSDKIRVSDRSSSLAYLRSIQTVLQKFGIKSVRLRPHPVEDPTWYMYYLDNNFFKIDVSPLTESLKNATLVIGPTSTVFLEASYMGVNYLIYEPIQNELDLISFPPVNPFDNSDSRIPVAQSEEKLFDFINQKVMVDPLFFKDYIKTPFNLEEIKKILK